MTRYNVIRLVGAIALLLTFGTDSWAALPVQAAPASVDIRQNGSLTISGNLVEGSQVYIDIPIKNFGSSTSPHLHAYTEGYTAKGSLWRADGAQPTAVALGPGQKVTIRVKADLWAGHLGTWTTYGVYLWNDDSDTYISPLAANGYNQSLAFVVTLDIRQDGPIQVSGTLVERNKVFLTFPVKNYSSSASPAIHPYIEGLTGAGSLWRADGAQPTGVILQPGQSVTFQVQNDLWSGHAGEWTTTGVYLWNDSNNTYYGPLVANGYDQTIQFAVATPADIRQNGAIEQTGSLVEGGTVYLNIPIKNFGGVQSPPLHVYTEGYTGAGSLWRADGAQPTAVVLQPGQSTNIQVSHDLWYGHAGSWTTYGAYIWNDGSNSYLGPLASNGYNQQLSFNVDNQRLRSLDVQYQDKSNDAVEVTYHVVSENADGSLTADITVRSKTLIPYMWDVSIFGGADNPEQSLHKLEQMAFMALLPKISKTFKNVRFTKDSSVQFQLPKYGLNDLQFHNLVLIHMTNVLAADIFGSVPTADKFRTYDDFRDSGVSLLEDATGLIPLELYSASRDLEHGDMRGLLEEMVTLGHDIADAAFEAGQALLVSPPTRTAILGALDGAGLVIHFYQFSRYFFELATMPDYLQVTVVPSTRPTATTSQTSASVATPLDARPNYPVGQPIGLEFVAVSSDHGPGWGPQQLTDGNSGTAWASGGTTPSNEWVTLRLTGSVSARLTTVGINPGSGAGDQIGSALKSFELDNSLDGIHYSALLTGTIDASQTGQMQYFSLPNNVTEYIRLLTLSNQSDNALGYVDVGELTVSGTVLSQDDYFEPDSQKELASWMGVATGPGLHSFGYPQDTDWIKVDLVANNQYTVRLTAIGKTGGHVLTVFAPDGSELLSATAGPGQPKSVQFSAPQTGVYYVELGADAANAAVYGPDTSYSIAVINSTHSVYLPSIN